MTAPTPLKIAVGLPVYGGKLTAGHAVMWLSFGHALATHKERFQLVHFQAIDMPDIARARQTLLQDALLKGADWLLMVDADTWHEGNADGGYDLLQMISTGQKANAAIIAAPVKKHDGTYNVVYRDGDGWATKATPSVCLADRIGTACMAISLKEIQRIEAELFHGDLWPLFRSEVRLPLDHSVGEDIFFCDAVSGGAGVILCDGRFVPKHLAKAQVLQ